MKKALIVTIYCLAAVSAFAQQTQTPSEQALGGKLLAEITSGLQCSANLITVRQTLALAQARVKELEEKYETQTETPK